MPQLNLIPEECVPQSMFSPAIEIPPAAFVDPDNPTQAEVEAWINANHANTPPDTMYYLVGDGTNDNPDYVWITDRGNRPTRVESPPPSIGVPIAIPEINADHLRTADLFNFFPNACNHMAVLNANWFIRNPGATITNIRWRVIRPDASIMFDINGAPTDDATVLAPEIVDGTLESLIMTFPVDVFDPDLNIGDFQIQMQVTDSTGDVSTLVTSNLTDVNIDTFYFNVTGDVNFDMRIDSLTNGPFIWDFGDGNTLTGTGIVDHPYAASGPYTVTLRTPAATMTAMLVNGGADPLQDIGLIGAVGDIFAEVPPCFLRLLTGIDLHGQPGLTDPSWPNMHELPALTTFEAENSGLTGVFPRPPIQLERLVLSNNNLTGVEGLGQLGALVDLNLADNNFSGPVFDYTAFTDLVSLDISGNAFTGDFTILDPSPIGASLQRFDISDNQFTGNFPDISALTGLQRFYINDNQITGNVQIPSNLGILEYDVSDNLLTGGMGDWTPLNGGALQILNLDNNSLTGQVTDLTGITTLQEFRINDNNLDWDGIVFDPNNNVLVLVDYGDNGGTAGQVDNAICQTDDASVPGGAANGTLNTVGNTAPTPTGDACTASLVLNGWTVTTD